MKKTLDLISVSTQVTDLEFALEKLRGAVISDAVRLNAHAEDITQLAERLDTLVDEQAGNDRTFRELISDKAELAHRVDELEAWMREGPGPMQRLYAVTARQAELAKCIERLEGRASNAIHGRVRAEAERDKLAERIEQLERLLERGD